ncbi:poly(R)-hydroxyalkanoic acid synthase subunit PhaE [Frateuria defendens]|uniref:poly(R)-hydroxyalkanoic acid synthase subunit PhaE n=1 Tax=Frateuria defendens TaxID=2219559 RepID=UPI00066FB3BC|nr:poly(R)-hydroxyalkanoic acid synthase subunit PhaE [Frateuria defendens]
MAEQANDSAPDYRAFAQQTWEAWMRQWQPPPAGAPDPAAGARASVADDVAARSQAALKSYLDWMQGAAASVAAPSGGQDWTQQLQQLFGGDNPLFGQAFAGLDQHGAQGFAQMWQSWLQAVQAGPGAPPPMPPLGLTREQQLQHQALTAAMLEYAETSARYRDLLQRVNVQAIERLQQRLAGDAGKPVESLKGLYDRWVDATEEVYAEVALSDEFKAIYGAMANAQMRVRQLQRQQTSEVCRELGIPTREEVDSLGQRLQALRREVAELRRQPAAKPPASAAAPKAARKSAAPAGTQSKAAEPKNKAAPAKGKAAKGPAARRGKGAAAGAVRQRT